MAPSARHSISETITPRFGDVIAGRPHQIGAGFKATHFSEDAFGGRMDPLIMVDDFVMTGPTFEPHLHAGISAVTLMLEDADGDFLNRDSLGNDVALEPGDLYWLAAASGAVHEERPAPGAQTHALQIFVNLPARLKTEPARFLHVKAGDMPVLSGPAYRVRVAVGRSGAAAGASGTPEEMTMLDGSLSAGGRFVHPLPQGRAAWIYARSGELDIEVGGSRQTLKAGTAITVAAGDSADLALSTRASAHFILMAAVPIREHFVKRGPLVMSSEADVQRTLSDHASGRFGRVPN